MAKSMALRSKIRYGIKPAGKPEGATKVKGPNKGCSIGSLSFKRK